MLLLTCHRIPDSVHRYPASTPLAMRRSSLMQTQLMTTPLKLCSAMDVNQDAANIGKRRKDRTRKHQYQTRLPKSKTSRTIDGL